jgi:hypothetical protein
MNPLTNSKAVSRQFLDKRDKIKNNLNAGRFFQGIIAGVNYSASPFLIQIQHIGEPAVAKGWHAVGSTTYYPIVGDRVQMVWQDEEKAQAVWPIGNPGRTSRMFKTSAQVLASGENFVQFDSVSTDQMGIASTISSGFIIVAPGQYKVAGACASATGSSRWLVSIYQNGTEVARLQDVGSSAFNAGSGTATLICQTGDLIQLGIYSGTSVNLQTASGTNFFEIIWAP